MITEKELPEEIKIDVKPAGFLFVTRVIETVYEAVEKQHDPKKSTEAIISLLCVAKYSDMFRIEDEKTLNLIKGFAKIYEDMAKEL